MQDAPGAQPASVGGGLLAAPAAHMMRGHSSALMADRPLAAVVAHQPPGLAALRTTRLGRERARVAAAADRPLRPLRRWASRATAVRAYLRSHRRARAAEHPPAPLAAARPHLPTVLAGDRRSGPADRAQVRVALDSETHDRAHTPAPPAGPDRPLIAALAPRSSFAVRPIVRSPHSSHGSGEPCRQCEHCACSPGGRDRRRLVRHVVHVVCGRSRALRADPFPGPVAAVHAAHRARSTGLM